ncbi:MAG: YraN family protein [Planctomycetota bacterium]|jgi:putative endonuclease
MEKRHAIGRRGERAAERYCRRAGMVILARNWRGGGGELDLVALAKRTLVFIEVKTRSTPRADGRRPVTVAQRCRTVAAANRFRSRYGVPELPYRFDLIEVDATTGNLRWEKNYHRAGRQAVQEER